MLPRRIAVGLAALALAGTGGAVAPDIAQATTSRGAPGVAQAHGTAQGASAVLRRAVAALAPQHTGVAARHGSAAHRESAAPHSEDGGATLALRDLFLARAGLTGREAQQADALLARPTDGLRDPYGDGYLLPSQSTCGPNVCVHSVRLGPDAPPNSAWVRTTLSVMEKVWTHHIRKLGYRRPPTDGSRGGGPKFDVYLKELGGAGVYGYCAPERRMANQPRRASSFCVLDDDFARSQFGRDPIDSLRVTAAHEFFHAVQFGYDFREDRWFLENTATWMEERYADDVNDNRQYLRQGQIADPGQSLDVFDTAGVAQYSNWIFWEFLSERYGVGIVKRVIERAGTGQGLPNDYSIQAARRVLERLDGWAQTFADYSAGNTVPASSYREGRFFPAAPLRGKAVLTARKPTYGRAERIDHLASRSFKVRPGAGLRGDRWRLRVAVDGPSRVSTPAAVVLVRPRNGRLQRIPVRLDRRGDGSVIVPFDGRRIATVTVTLVNASTRYRCGRDTLFSCTGVPRDDGKLFRLGLKAVRR